MNRIEQPTTTARPLTKKDLDERIGRVAEELFGPDVEGRDWVPVPISFADYAERMRKFMVYN